ncbi:LOW QUALITY PROTEIN: multicilin [Neosynchiropus ocellatus]
MWTISATAETRNLKRKMQEKGRQEPMPRSSSPLTVYVELPCIIEQAFSSVACGGAARVGRDSLESQVNDSGVDDQDFGDYAKDFIADSPVSLENSLSPAALVPFEGCIIPPLTPQRFFSPEESLGDFSAEQPQVHYEAPWKVIRHCQDRVFEHSLEVNQQLHETLHQRQEEIFSLQERNSHLRQLASRAKHLASVLEKLTASRESSVGGQTSPSKRRRLAAGCEPETSVDDVEGMLRDISTRCNAVLHSTSGGNRPEQELEPIRMFGSFSGLQTCVGKVSSVRTEGDAAGEGVSSFKTSIREHGTIRTKVFPHGHVFTSSTQQGGCRFRWVPNQS